MSSRQAVQDDIEVDVHNIGGIDETHVTFEPGVTILTGRNATNRTSLLQAIMAALGSEQATLKADADDGGVSLTIDGETYERRLQRDNSGVMTDGEPYLNDPDVADLFAFLLEDNEARQAVERDADLREIIMRPVDTEAIQAEIEELTAEKQQVEEQLEEFEELERRLPELEAECAQLEEQLEDKTAELAAKEAELDDLDGEIEATREAKAELDEKLAQLRETRSELEDVRYDLETERESLDSLREETADLEAELDALSETPAGDIQEINARLDALHDRKQALSTDVSQLQNIIQFNEEMVEDTDTDMFAALTDEQTAETSESPTDKLLKESETITCWTCGSTVERGQVSSILDQLRELRQSKLQERNDIDEEIQDLQSEQQTLEQQQQRRETLERKLRQREDEIERAEETIDDLETRREELTEQVEQLEETVEELEAQEYSDLLELHKEANQLEFEIDRLEDERADTKGEIESIEARLEQRDDLEDQRSEIQSQLEDLRMKIDRIEQTASEEFNEHMEALLDELAYENIERVWIERTEQDVREGRRKVAKSVFELHVIRETESGQAYEDTLNHLSESEREVVGVVFALAGYLTHDVYARVPFMLLDSLEALDSERIATLIEYVQTYVDNLIVALLPEDAALLNESFQRITDI